MLSDVVPYCVVVDEVVVCFVDVLDSVAPGGKEDVWGFGKEVVVG